MIDENWRVDVLAYGETQWATNALEYASAGLAAEAGQKLRDKWTRVDKLRIVPVSTPRDEVYEAGSENVL